MAVFELDPGHGAHDPGAIGSKSKEKDNVLKVAKKLKSLLEDYGHTVYMTRSSDKFVSLNNRASKANKDKVDYFISLHNNSAAARSATGFETFIYNGNVGSKTKDFQTAIHNAIARSIGIRNRGKKRANFAVLRQTKMPAVLIEYAFISNNEDEKILINKVDKLAEWTCDGIIDAVGGMVKAKPKKMSTSEYKGNSLVDYLKAVSINSSFSNRKKLAVQHGIKNYKGTASQNLTLLSKLRSESATKTAKKGDQKTTSVVDYLKSIGVDSSFSNRKKLAEKYGIKNYSGTATQNTLLLKKLRG